MSRFAPVRPVLEDLPGDALGHSLVHALARPIGSKQSWGVITTLTWSVLTFGTLPLLVWIRSFRRFGILEQQQLVQMTRWVTAGLAPGDGELLLAAARGAAPRRWTGVLAVLTLLLTSVVAAAAVSDSHLNALEAMAAIAFGGAARTWHGAADVRWLWIAGVAAAYLWHWLGIQLHATDLKRVVLRFNQIAQAQQLPAAQSEPLGIPVRPLWLMGAACLCAMGAPWGAAVMLAGSAQRRYINWAGRNTRAELAQRVRTMMLARQAALGHSAEAALPVYLRQRCIEPRCRAELPRGVVFCRRCGTAQAQGRVGAA